MLNARPAFEHRPHDVVPAFEDAHGVVALHRWGRDSVTVSPNILAHSYYSFVVAETRSARPSDSTFAALKPWRLIMVNWSRVHLHNVNKALRARSR
jgi:hypothetical protein